MHTTDALPLAFRLLRLSDRLTALFNLPHQPLIDLAMLRHCPAGSFGQAVVRHFEQNQIQPFHTGLRRKQLHDAVHVLTGYGTDPLGEAEVQAFLLGAKFHPAQVLLGLGTVVLVRRRSPEVEQAQCPARLNAAYDRGRQSRFDPDTWEPERFWSAPLAQVRQHYGV